MEQIANRGGHNTAGHFDIEDTQLAIKDKQDYVKNMSCLLYAQEILTHFTTYFIIYYI